LTDSAAKLLYIISYIILFGSFKKRTSDR
jgi:hypothetical protein